LFWTKTSIQDLKIPSCPLFPALVSFRKNVKKGFKETKYGFICILACCLELEVKNPCNEIFTFISLVAGVIDTSTVSNLKLPYISAKFQF
jgi:hypothetical protein